MLSSSPFDALQTSSMTQRTPIAFVGGGNMASSLVGGLLAGGWQAEGMRIAEPVAERRAELAARLGVRVTDTNQEAAAGARVVVLAVKPHVVRTVAAQLGPLLRDQQSLVLSIAAGVREADIRRWLGHDAAVVRAMPNTPALVRGGATGLYANPFVAPEERDLAESVLRAVGMTLWVAEEGLLDVVTAVSGSGPAYFFLLMEALADAGSELGLSGDTARLLALETAFGAAKMALESPEDPATLRARVTSPGGTTEQAIARFEAGGLRRLVLEAVTAARDRAAAIGDELGGD